MDAVVFRHLKECSDRLLSMRLPLSAPGRRTLDNKAEGGKECKVMMLLPCLRLFIQRCSITTDGTMRGREAERVRRLLWCITDPIELGDLHCFSYRFHAMDEPGRVRWGCR